MFESTNKLDKLFLQIARKSPLISSLYPINLDEEKNKFIKSKTYNPQLKYRSANLDDFDHAGIEQALESIDSNWIANLYKEKYQYLIAKTQLIENIGTNSTKFTELSNTMFPIIARDEYIKMAESIIQDSLETQNLQSQPNIYLTHDEIIDEIKMALARFDIDVEIKIHNKTNSSSLFIDFLNNIIYIPSNCRKTQDQLNGTIAHEIETHLVRAVNGKKAQIGIFHFGTARYLETEEGLAIMNTKKARNNYSQKSQAITYLSIIRAQEQSFRQIYDWIFEITGKQNLAFNITSRVKRGLGDTSQPGGFTKDQYFPWYLKTKETLEKNPDYGQYIYKGKATAQELYDYHTKFIPTA